MLQSEIIMYRLCVIQAVAGDEEGETCEIIG
jgi:hypothetical protein